MSEPLKLNLGGGDLPLPGFVTVDRKGGEEVFPLKYADGEVDEVYASHVLEHFAAGDVPLVLAEWCRVLKPGGRIRIAVPDLMKIATEAANGNPNRWPIEGYIYGGQTDENDFHKMGFTARSLRVFMEQAGFTGIESWKPEFQDCATLPVSLNLQGYKPGGELETEAAPAVTEPGKVALPKTVALMTLGRLAFTHNMFSALDVAKARGITFQKVEGVFWGQCMTRLIQPHLTDGTEWLWVLDYDSVFQPAHFDALATLMLKHPEADAIAPLQVKRESDRLLWTLCDESGNQLPQDLPLKYFDADIVPAFDAHFGCTLIRTSAIRKMKKPWFVESPDEWGEWGEGREDCDLAFWRLFKEAGNKLYVAPRVAIGHEQSVITWPDQYLKPFHQYTGDYAARRMPPEARR